MINIEIAYAPSVDLQKLETLELPVGTTVLEALRQSRLVQIYPELVDFPKGVFGVRVTDEDTLHDGDRLEVYRKLTVDPMQKRKNRARR